jgi:signal transduction histidine kinase
MSLPSSLIDHICSRLPAITNAWLRALWRSPEFSTPENIPAPQLIDHVPKIFDDLADYLRGDGAPQAEQSARTHGRYRWEQHFRLEEVLREMLVLRGIIIAEIEHYMAEHEPSAVAVSLEARRRVAAFFDDVLLYSASQFSEQQQARIEEDRRLIARQHQFTPTELQALDAARLRLLRTIAHELRNMLNAAVLTIENLIVEDDPTWRTELQEMLKRSHRQMTTLVNQLLEMAPLLAGREALRLAPLNVQAFAAQQCTLFERMAASKRLKFRGTADEELSEVITDELKLQRIITNLVQNALKFTPAGGSVELRFEPVNAERWSLSVSDTGPGIPEEHCSKIFEEFHRVPGTEQLEGSGLGLSIVRQLVGLMHGEISLVSEVGVGSTFCITLPRDPDKAA